MPTLKLIPNGAKGQVGSRSCADSEGYMFGHDGDRALGVASINCLVGQPGQFTEQVMATRTAWGKQHLKIEAYHWVLAFAEDELDPNDPESTTKALALTADFARRAWSTRQTLLVAQNDGESGLLHVHILVGSVDPLTGKAARGSDMTWERVVQHQWAAMADQGMTQSAKLPTTVEEAKQRAEDNRKDRYQRAANLVRGALASEPPTSWEDALDLLNRTPGLRKAQIKVAKSRGKVTGKRLVITLDEPGARPFDAQRGGDDLAYDALTTLWEQNEEDRYYAQRKAERDAFMAYMFPDDENQPEPDQPEHPQQEPHVEEAATAADEFDPVTVARAQRPERTEPSALDKALRRLAVEDEFAKLCDGDQEAEVG